MMQVLQFGLLLDLLALFLWTVQSRKIFVVLEGIFASRPLARLHRHCCLHCDGKERYALLEVYALPRELEARIRLFFVESESAQVFIVYLLILVVTRLEISDFGSPII
jgi:hypothetical protein